MSTNEIELAGAYKDLLKAYAWRDLKERMAAQLRSQDISFHALPCTDIDLIAIGELRGWHQAFNWIETEIDFILNGGERHAKEKKA